MGANTAYWQIRYGDVNQGADAAPRGRQLICFKSLDDPTRYRGRPDEAYGRITMRFRDGGRWPETMLMGVAYRSWFSREVQPPLRFPYLVVRNDLPFFANTGYEPGQTIGDVVGYEWDNTDPAGDGRRLWNAESSRIPAIDPASIQVLFRGTPVDVDGRPGIAEAVYFRSEAGAEVFSSGTIRWSWGLGKPGFESEKFRVFNSNLVAFLLRKTPG